MKRGDVYWAALDPIRGSEQAGTRPVVVVSRDAINVHSPVVVVCPATNAAGIRRLYPSDVAVDAPEGGFRKRSIVMTAQIRAISKTRLSKPLGEVTLATLARIDEALRITLDL